MTTHDELAQLRNDIADAMSTLEQLDSTNEHLRMRLLDTIRWWEDDVTAGIARERALHRQNENLERQIHELTNSLPIRLTRPLISLRERLLKLRRTVEP